LDEGSARRVVGFALSGLLAGDGAGCICCWGFARCLGAPTATPREWGLCPQTPPPAFNEFGCAVGAGKDLLPNCLPDRRLWRYDLAKSVDASGLYVMRVGFWKVQPLAPMQRKESVASTRFPAVHLNSSNLQVQHPKLGQKEGFGL